MKLLKNLTVLLITLFPLSIAQAKIVSSSSSHYVLKHEQPSTLSTSQVWQKLLEPSQWWLADHTYSGDANNLSLDAQAGGLWREDWEENSVLHGRVLNVQATKTLRLEAPFGPLQGMAVNAIWTISIQSDAEGSIITFDEVVTGNNESDLKEVAKAVDYVKGLAIKSLAKAD